MKKSNPWDTLELYVSDIHFPYHDDDAWGLVLKCVRELKPHCVFLGGDIVDFYAMSSFDREPKRRLELQEEVDFTSSQLAMLRKAAPKAEIMYQEGNHETRLTRYLQRHAVELSGLRALTTPELLGLASLNIRWVPQGQDCKLGDLWHVHGNEFGGGGQTPAQSILKKASGNLIMGHWHRIQAAYHRTMDGVLYGCWINGCLCTLNPDWLHKPQWQQGFTLVHYGESGLFHVDQIPLFKGKSNKLSCFVQGKLFTT